MVDNCILCSVSSYHTVYFFIIGAQGPLQTLAHGDLYPHWCICELSCTYLSWCGPVWELSGCLMTARGAILPQWLLSLQQWLPGALLGAKVIILELIKKLFWSSILLLSSQQLDHPALHSGGRGVCFRSTGQPPSPALSHGATWGTRLGEQWGLSILLYSPLCGRQGVGVQAAAPVLLSSAGWKPPSSVLQHRTAFQRILLCKSKIKIFLSAPSLTSDS